MQLRRLVSCCPQFFLRDRLNTSLAGYNPEPIPHPFSPIPYLLLPAATPVPGCSHAMAAFAVITASRTLRIASVASADGGHNSLIASARDSPLARISL